VKQVTVPLYLLLLLSLLTISCTSLPSSEEKSPITMSGSKEKKSNSMFPEGKELIILLSATISPEIITTEGSDLRVNFVNKDSISTTNLIPVVVFVTNTMTIKTSLYSGTNFNSDYIIFNVSNPSSYGISGYGEGRLSGSGTIYVYLEDLGDSTSGDDNKRVSNILSVYATFK